MNDVLVVQNNSSYVSLSRESLWYEQEVEAVVYCGAIKILVMRGSK